MTKKPPDKKASFWFPSLLASSNTIETNSWFNILETKNSNIKNHNLQDTNFWHYSLQLNTYKKMIEEKYGKKVTKLCLVCLHPNNKNKSFQLISVPDLQNELNDLFALRKKEINTPTT